MSSCYKHENEIFGFRKGGQFLEQLSSIQLLKKAWVSINWLFKPSPVVLCCIFESVEENETETYIFSCFKKLPNNAKWVTSLWRNLWTWLQVSYPWVLPGVMQTPSLSSGVIQTAHVFAFMLCTTSAAEITITQLHNYFFFTFPEHTLYQSCSQALAAAVQRLRSAFACEPCKPMFRQTL